jgi:hypothetical protein
VVQVTDGNKLSVGPDLVLEKGSAVVIRRRGLPEEVFATITKVSLNEVMIKQQTNEDGSGGLSARLVICVGMNIAALSNSFCADFSPF